MPCAVTPTSDPCRAFSLTLFVAIPISRASTIKMCPLHSTCMQSWCEALITIMFPGFNFWEEHSSVSVKTDYTNIDVLIALSVRPTSYYYIIFAL